MEMLPAVGYKTFISVRTAVLRLLCSGYVRISRIRGSGKPESAFVLILQDERPPMLLFSLPAMR